MNTSTEISFIDGNLSNISTLIAGLAPNSQYVILDPAQDGVEQMAEVLSAYRNLSAIHVLSHGTDASVQLGSAVLNPDTLSRYSRALADIGNALNAEGDLLWYGCNVAQSLAGQAFLTLIT